MGERPTPDAPHPGTRRPPGRPRAAAATRKGSSQERAVGLVTGPHARIPPNSQLVGSGFRQPAKRAGSRGPGERPTSDAPHPGKRRPLGHPHAAPTARKGSSQECALWGW